MNILSVSAVLTYVVAKFPGGFEGFKNGGIIVAMPNPSNDILIYHPHMPPNLRKELENEAKQSVGEQKPHPIVIDDVYDLENSDELITKFKNDILEIEPKVTMVVTLLAIILTATHLKSNGERGIKLRKTIQNSEGIHRVYILWKDRCELLTITPVDVKQAIDDLINSL